MKDKLLKIQTELKAPKKCFNAFGKYNYRSAEDILEAVKPLLAEYKCTLKLIDELVNIGDRYYIKATAKLEDTEGTGCEETTGYAREEEAKKGMDGSQITGASSSYARKYALNGLFLIDDSKDSDYTNKHGEDEVKEKKEGKYKEFPYAKEETVKKENLRELLEDCNDLNNDVFPLWCLLTKSQQADKEISEWFKLRKAQIKDEQNG